MKLFQIWDCGVCWGGRAITSSEIYYYINFLVMLTAKVYPKNNLYASGF